jgi:hypothetical protein
LVTASHGAASWGDEVDSVVSATHGGGVESLVDATDTVKSAPSYVLEYSFPAT